MPSSVSMITFAVLHGKPVLVGVDGAQSVVKPLENGDEGLSFESLFDDAISGDDYRKMERAGVISREAIPPAIYEALIRVKVGVSPQVRVRIQARNDAEMRRGLRGLFENEAFLGELITILARQLCESTDIAAVTSGGIRVEDVAPADAPEWEIIK